MIQARAGGRPAGMASSARPPRTLMTERVRKLLDEAMSLSIDECRELAGHLLSSLRVDAEWLGELESRARRAVADLDGGEAWEIVERRLAARIANR